MCSGESSSARRTDYVLRDDYYFTFAFSSFFGNDDDSLPFFEMTRVQDGSTATSFRSPWRTTICLSSPRNRSRASRLLSTIWPDLPVEDNLAIYHHQGASQGFPGDLRCFRQGVATKEPGLISFFICHYDHQNK